MRRLVCKYILWGIMFTLIGPCLFWILFPVGPVASAFITETTVHTIRYNVYKRNVFSNKELYDVTVMKYIKACIPVTAGNICFVGLLSLITKDRTQITILATGFGIVLGIIANSLSFTRKKGKGNEIHKQYANRA